MSASSQPTRRNALSVGAAAVVGAGALSACSTTEDAASTVTSAASAAQGAASAAGAAAQALSVKVADIPVGGAVVTKVGDRSVVLSRPSTDKVVAFNAACTHQGCPVTASGAKLNCPCHGSVFNAATGAVEQGPASQPLGTIAVTVAGDAISLA